jgi:hypothetical protein
MGDGEAFPNFFYSKEPLSDNVNLIKLKDGKQDKFYWMLSLDNGLQQSEQQTSGHSALGPYDDNDSKSVNEDFAFTNFDLQLKC